MTSPFRFPGAGLHANIGGAVQTRITERERAASIQGDIAEHTFGIDIYGTGRVSDMRCTFGFAFTHQPDVAYGLALHVGDTITGTTPVPRVAVHRWVQNDAGLYLAAHVSIIVTGHRRQRAKVTVKFSGIGITLPLGPSTSSTSSSGGFSFSDPLP